MAVSHGYNLTLLTLTSFWRAQMLRNQLRNETHSALVAKANPMLYARSSDRSHPSTHRKTLANVSYPKPVTVALQASIANCWKVIGSKH